MSPNYLQGAGSSRSTPQRDPIPGRTDQVANSEGGYVFAVSPMETLRRFLILGSADGTYYADEVKAVERSVDGVFAAFDQLGVEAVAEIVDVSVNNRAPKNREAVYALALAAGHTNEAVRKAAYTAIPRVCRASTDLFAFCEHVREQRGFGGRALRRAVGRWYTEQSAKDLAYQAVKYRQRDGYTHHRVLRLAHPRITEPDARKLADWITGRSPSDALKAEFDRGNGAGHDGALLETDDTLRILEGFERAQRSPNAATTAALVMDYGLPWEAIRTEHHEFPEVWAALVENGMPIHALVRNLPRLTRNGALASDRILQLVTGDLRDLNKLRYGRMHPAVLLNALVTYGQGQGRGSTWTPIQDVVDALDDGFYAAFDAIEPTGARHLVALDVSASMTWNTCAGMSALDPRTAASALAMTVARTEPNYRIVAFADGDWTGAVGNRYVLTGIADAPISPRQRLDDVIKSVHGMRAGGTDCALPMLYALDREIEVDVFMILTDSETWAGTPHPIQALDQYRKASGINAKLVVVGMEGNPFTIADPNDAGSLDVVGFDSSAPQAIASFVRGL